MVSSDGCRWRFPFVIGMNTCGYCLSILCENNLRIFHVLNRFNSPEALGCIDWIWVANGLGSHETLAGSKVGRLSKAQWINLSFVSGCKDSQIVTKGFLGRLIVLGFITYTFPKLSRQFPMSATAILVLSGSKMAAHCWFRNVLPGQPVSLVTTYHLLISPFSGVKSV